MINPSQASAQLEMVDRILSRTDRTVHLSGWIYIVWGLAAALTDVMFQLYVDHRVGVAGLAIAGAAVLVAVGFMVFHLRRLRRGVERVAHVQRQVGSMFFACWIGAIVVSYASPHIFAGWAQGAIWSVCAAITLLFIGLQGDRRALWAAAVLLASVIAASALYPFAGYVMAAGFLIAYTGFGLLLLASGNAVGEPSDG